MVHKHEDLERDNDYAVVERAKAGDRDLPGVWWGLRSGSRVFGGQ